MLFFVVPILGLLNPQGKKLQQCQNYRYPEQRRRKRVEKWYASTSAVLFPVPGRTLHPPLFSSLMQNIYTAGTVVVFCESRRPTTGVTKVTIVCEDHSLLHFTCDTWALPAAGFRGATTALELVFLTHLPV